MQITAEITAPDGEGKRFVPSEGNHLNLYTIIVPFSSHITEKIVIVIRFVTTKRPNLSVSFLLTTLAYILLLCSPAPVTLTMKISGRRTKIATHTHTHTPGSSSNRSKPGATSAVRG